MKKITLLQNLNRVIDSETGQIIFTTTGLSSASVLDVVNLYNEKNDMTKVMNLMLDLKFPQSILKQLLEFDSLILQ